MISSAYASVVRSRRGRLFLDDSLESFGRLAPGVWLGGMLICVVVEGVGGIVVGGAHLGSCGHVMVIGDECLSYGVERVAPC